MKTYLISLCNNIINDILETLIYLPIGITVILICILTGFAITLALSRFTIKITKAQLLRNLAASFLIGYIVIILFITIFSRSPGTRTGVDLIPLATIGNGAKGDAYVIENILLFVPFGFLLPISFKKIKKLWQAAGIGLIFSIAIEIIQYNTKRGHAQTDDVLMNVIGTGIGFLACSYWLWHDIFNK